VSTEAEAISEEERVRRLKLVQKEVKRLNMAKLADYLKVSRPSVDVMTLPAQSYKLFAQNREACAASQIRFNGDVMLYQGYRLKEAGNGL
jgi:hypothetical protein